MRVRVAFGAWTFGFQCMVFSGARPREGLSPGSPVSSLPSWVNDFSQKTFLKSSFRPVKTDC